MLDFGQVLKSKGILVGDGAWGTLLMEQGLTAGDCPERWNRDHPERVEAVARAYVNAGADIIETNTFGANRIKLDHYGLGEQALEINRLAAGISRNAAGRHVLVMGSMGPTGKIIETGEVREEEVYTAFAEQARGLEQGGSDMLIVETMSEIAEARLAVRAALENTGLPVVCSMSFQMSAGDDQFTMMGHSVQDFIDAFRNSGLTGLGSNCGNGTGEMLRVAGKLSETAGEMPLLIQANAGVPAWKDGKTVFPDKPADWEKYVLELVSLRIDIIGGCCGTNPEFIRHIRYWIDKAMSVS